MRHRPVDLLGDIREAIGYIAEDTAEITLEEFDRDRRVRQLVAHNFEIVGEAVNRWRHGHPTVVERIRNQHPYITLRNVLIHRHDVIDYSVLWNVARRNLPNLEEEVTALLRAESQ